MEARVVSCEVSGGDYGVIVGAGCEATLQANHFTGSVTGAAVVEGSSVLRRNRFENCGNGIVVEGGTPVIEANVCRENAHGVAFTNAAGGTARKNECVANQTAGILV
jgi:hypothetical protein